MSVTLSEMTAYLEVAIKSGSTICYSDVDNHFHMPKTFEWKDNPLYSLYGMLDEEDHKARRPYRTSIIVKKVGEKKTIPSDGYFKRLSQHRNIPIAKTAAEKRELHANELAALFKRYEVNPKNA